MENLDLAYPVSRDDEPLIAKCDDAVVAFFGNVFHATDTDPVSIPDCAKLAGVLLRIVVPGARQCGLEFGQQGLECSVGIDAPLDLTSDRVSISRYTVRFPTGPKEHQCPYSLN